MDNRTIKVRIKDTDEIVEVRKVGANTYLDETNKEIYNKEDFEEVQEEEEESSKDGFTVMSPQDFLKNMKSIVGDREKQSREEFAKMMLSYEMSLTIEVVKKRPFMSPERVYRKVSKIVKNTIKRLD